MIRFCGHFWSQKYKGSQIDHFWSTRTKNRGEVSCEAFLKFTLPDYYEAFSPQIRDVV